MVYSQCFAKIPAEKFKNFNLGLYKFSELKYNLKHNNDI